MTTYTIEPAIFEMYPDYRRGIIVADGIVNHEADSHTAELLFDEVKRVSQGLSDCERERLDAWNIAFLKFGADANRFTPSVRFLYEQILRGRPMRSINALVNLFNVASLRWAAPCGGDDLDSLGGGDLTLGLARGDETFAPLFKPDAFDNPQPGEVVYFTPQTRRVMCRRWIWRNSDFSKLSSRTQRAVVNVDMIVPPYREEDLDCALDFLQRSIVKFCSGAAKSFVLSRNHNIVEIQA